MEIKDVLEKYYKSLNKKDDTWKELWAQDAVFSDASQTLKAQGKNAVIQSFTPFLKGVERITVKEFIIEGDKACAIICYDYINSKGEKMSQDDAEICQVRDGKLVQMILYFDLTAYRIFMKS